MFFTFLNKEKAIYPDLSLLQKYTPEEVLFYYYNSQLTIPLDIYKQLKQEAETEEDPLAPICQWITLLDEGLEAGKDIESFENNEYLNIIGPYYYPFSNTRFYFEKGPAKSFNQITADDISTIMRLEFLEPMDKEVLLYHKNHKSPKKGYKNKADLMNDINMCMTALREIEKINKHINYLSKLLENRYSIVNIEALWPQEPDILPEKPRKLEQTPVTSGNLILFSSLKARKKKKNLEDENHHFNQQMKIYLLRYKEYEKACDRYKAVLENWEDYHADFIERCHVDIEITESKLKNAQKNQRIYNNIISKSLIHPDYQEYKILNTFKHYLETGRANDLQDCMNIYEEEQHWGEIKASQERIENTIYFLQNSDDTSRLANDHIEKLLKKLNDRENETLTAGQ
jgi:uncharacterized protein (DUF1697 family)